MYIRKLYSIIALLSVLGNAEAQSPSLYKDYSIGDTKDKILNTRDSFDCSTTDIEAVCVKDYIYEKNEVFLTFILENDRLKMISVLSPLTRRFQKDVILKFKYNFDLIAAQSENNKLDLVEVWHKHNGSERVEVVNSSLNSIIKESSYVICYADKGVFTDELLENSNNYKELFKASENTKRQICHGIESIDGTQMVSVIYRLPSLEAELFGRKAPNNGN